MIELDGHTLTINQLWEGAAKECKCKLATSAKSAMRQSRAFVDRLARQQRAIYGINTGFGPLSHTRVCTEDLGQHQINLIHHLSVGQGDQEPSAPPFPEGKYSPAGRVLRTFQALTRA